MNKKWLLISGVTVLSTSLAVVAFASDTMKPNSISSNIGNQAAIVASEISKPVEKKITITPNDLDSTVPPSPVTVDMNTVKQVDIALDTKAVKVTDEKISYPVYVASEEINPVEKVCSAKPVQFKKPSETKNNDNVIIKPPQPIKYDSVIIGTVPDDPKIQAEVKYILNIFAFAENYKSVPKPPVGDWKPGVRRIYLTDEEVKQVPVKGIPYGEAMVKDTQGKYYTEVNNQPPKELIEWSERYNMKIPQWNVPSLKSYENMVLSQQYVNTDWWVELRGEIEINLKAYEKWFFEACVLEPSPEQNVNANGLSEVPEISIKVNTPEKAVDIFKTSYPYAHVTSTKFYDETKEWEVSFTIASQVNRYQTVHGTACINAVTGEIKPAVTTAN